MLREASTKSLSATTADSIISSFYYLAPLTHSLDSTRIAFFCCENAWEIPKSLSAFGGEPPFKSSNRKQRCALRVIHLKI
jgi:hypothetical protein